MRILWYTQHDKLKFEEVNMADIGDKLKSAREAKDFQLQILKKLLKFRADILKRLRRMNLINFQAIFMLEHLFVNMHKLLAWMVRSY